MFKGKKGVLLPLANVPVYLYVTENLGPVPVSVQLFVHLGLMIGLLEVEGEASSSRSSLSPSVRPEVSNLSHKLP